MKKILLSIVAMTAAITASAQFAPENRDALSDFKKGDKKQVILTLETAEAPVAYNLYITCPEGIDVDLYENDDEEMVPDIQKAGNRYKSHHGLTVKPVNGVPGKYMVACASTNGSASTATLKNTDGEPKGAVLAITFVAKEDNVKAPIMITESLAGFVGGSKTNFADWAIDVNGGTAINGISADETKSGVIYNMAGQRVSKATKGIYVVDGKKVAVSK